MAKNFRFNFLGAISLENSRFCKDVLSIDKDVLSIRYVPGSLVSVQVAIDFTGKYRTNSALRLQIIKRTFTKCFFL